MSVSSKRAGRKKNNRRITQEQALDLAQLILDIYKDKQKA